MKIMKNFIMTMLLFSATQVLGQVKDFTVVRESLNKKFKMLDEKFPGQFGVAIERVDNREKIGYNVDKNWYLSSTTKVPIAIAVLKEIEGGKLNLQDKVLLQQSDYVDGSGRINYEKPGVEYSIQELISRMIQESDSTATDMLVRTVGIDQINKTIQSMSTGFGPLTSILQVRYGAYGLLHPNAKKLTNMDFIDLKKSKPQERASAFAKKLKVKKSSLKHKTLEKAFEEYYKTGENSSNLVAFAELLTKLDKREILNEKHTSLLLNEMSLVKTGQKRIQAGLGSSYIFRQKTGTQVDRICNVGIIEAQATKRKIAIASCVADFPELGRAEAVLKDIGRLISETPDLF